MTSPDPLPRSDRFRLEIDSIDHERWVSVSGISNSVDSICHDERDERGRLISTRRRAKRSEGQLTVKRTFDGNSYFSDWWEDVMNGKEGALRSGAVILLNDTATTEIARFQFLKGWISSYSMSDLSASTEVSVITETFVIKHEGLDRV